MNYRRNKSASTKVMEERKIDVQSIKPSLVVINSQVDT